NVNDIVSDYLQTGVLNPKPATPTLSNAMDVGNPSNFVRILEIFHHDFPELKNQLSSHCISDEETMKTITEVFRQFQYTLDPHGAVAYRALDAYLKQHPSRRGIFLETAHPVKFPEAVEKATGMPVTLPEAVRGLMNQPGQSQKINADYSSLRDYLLR